MKTKLEILEINEDVVATSSVVHCAHPNTEHLYVTSNPYIQDPTDPEPAYCVDAYKYSANNYTGSNMFVFISYFGVSQSNISSGQWYYLDSNGKYQLCDGDHDNYSN